MENRKVKSQVEKDKWIPIREEKEREMKDRLKRKDILENAWEAIR